MRQSLAALTLFLAACAAPAAPALPPAEVLVTTDAGGAHHVVSVRSGATLRDLPAGALAVSLNRRGEFSEAFLAAAGGAVTQVLRIDYAHAYATEVVAEVGAAGVPQAALVPAPGLGLHPGPQTVLAVRFGDGRLTGYQDGLQVWSVARPLIAGRAVTQLVGLGGAAAVGDGVATWGLLVPATGELRPVPGCEAGPLAGIGSAVVFSCRGALDTIPTLGPPVPIGQLVGVPWTLPTPEGGVLMVWPGGDFLRLDRHAAVAGRGRLPAPSSRPVLTPDGTRLLSVTEVGVISFELDSQHSRQLVRETGVDSIALSRDGNFLYILRGGRLEILERGSGARFGDRPVAGVEIEVVAAG